MPEIKPKESRKDWMGRCIPYVIKNEGKTASQAAGKCGGMYDARKKRLAKAKRKRRG